MEINNNNQSMKHGSTKRSLSRLNSMDTSETLQHDYDFTDSDVRKDRKLFHASTSEIPEQTPVQLQRSSSLLSNSSRLSFMSTTGHHFAGTSSNVTLSSIGSSVSRSSYAQPETTSGWNDLEITADIEHGISGGRRHSSSTRFNEYLASTSSWDWNDDDDDEEHPDIHTELQDPFSFRRRRSYRNSITSENSDLMSFQSETGGKMLFQEGVHGMGSIGTEQPTTYCHASDDILRASCPTLNAVGHRSKPREDNFRNKNRSVVSASNFEISKEKASAGLSKAAGTSKSSNCISSVRKISFLENTTRPITLRFAPSGLTETSRIVWMSDRGNCNGTVRWVGKIRDQFYAGVEFDKAVGNSSGIYGYGHGLQIRLFTCKLGYGRFVPMEELILYEDFYENQKTGFICIICRDDFIEPGQYSDDGQGLDSADKFMTATKCGHLFHQTCLNKWFNEKAAASQHCPYCHFPMDRNDTIRIFPAQGK